MLVLEIKGYEDEQTRQKHSDARRWVAAVNNWGKLGRWVCARKNFREPSAPWAAPPPPGAHEHG